MERKTSGNAARFLAGRRSRRRWQRVVTALASVVVFCTTYMLILPAITLTVDESWMDQALETHVYINCPGAALYEGATFAVSSVPVAERSGLDVQEVTVDAEEMPLGDVPDLFDVTESQPPAAEPTVEGPPAAELPIEAPPAAEPTVEEPPAEEPPIKVIPATELPAEMIAAMVPEEPGIPEQTPIPAEPVEDDGILAEVTPPAEADGTEETEQPEEAETPEQTEQPEEAETPEQTEQAEEAEAPEQTEQPEEAEIPEQTEQAEEIEAPEETEQAEEIEAPEETEQTEELEQPEGTEEPEEIDIEDGETPTEEEPFVTIHVSKECVLESEGGEIRFTLEGDVLVPGWVTEDDLQFLVFHSVRATMEAGETEETEGTEGTAYEYCLFYYLPEGGASDPLDLDGAEIEVYSTEDGVTYLQSELPHTGGAGLMVWYTTGGVLLTTAACLLYKKKREEETA